MRDGKTQAETVYSSAYRQAPDKAGIPDSKIADGVVLKDRKILSLGSGDCADIWYLAGENEIHAIDSSQSAIDVANSHRIKGRIHDLEQKLPFGDEMFDLVVCKDLMEHLVSPENLLKEIRRVIKPEGRLVISIPNHFYLLFRLKILLGRNLIWKSIIHDHTKDFEEWNYMHLRFFTYGGLVKFLALGDFEVEKGFWDFGTLAHYSSPDLFHDHLVEKYRDRPLTTKAWVFFHIFHPAWRVFNMVFPRRLRSGIVGLAPGLLCAGFYLRCRIKQANQGLSK